MLRIASLLLLVTLCNAAGCGGGAHDRTLTIFAASSLTEPFDEAARAFEASHAGTKLKINFAGSPALRTQLEQGARADLLATADRQNMQAALDAGLVRDAGTTFANNRLAIIVPKSNPAGVASPADLASSCPGGCPPSNDPCYDIACRAGQCVVTVATDGTACRSADRCRTGSTCTGGRCQGGQAAICPAPSTPCQAASCDPQVGCRFVAANDGVVCEDGDVCTVGTRCAAGECTGGSAVSCPALSCKDNRCDPFVGCTATPVPAGEDPAGDCAALRCGATCNGAGGCVCAVDGGASKDGGAGDGGADGGDGDDGGLADDGGGRDALDSDDAGSSGPLDDGVARDLTPPIAGPHGGSVSSLAGGGCSCDISARRPSEAPAAALLVGFALLLVAAARSRRRIVRV